MPTSPASSASSFSSLHTTLPLVPVKRVAAIDLGTNSFHVVLADLFSDGHYEVVDTLKEMVLLADDGDLENLSEPAMDRGIAALKKIRALCDGQDVERILAYATSAIREAKNGGQFIQRAIDEAGIKINAISGLLEAELIAYGVQYGMKLGRKEHMIADIGGGSVEFIIADQQEITWLDSRKIGVARLTAEFVHHDPITKEEILALKHHIQQELQSVREAWGDRKKSVLIGSSGTMQNVAMMISQRRGMEIPITLNEFEFSRKEFTQLKEEILSSNRQKRTKIAGLDEKRVDLIQAGVVLVDELIQTFGAKSIRISSQALREGILIRYMKKMMKAEQPMVTERDPRRRSIFQLARKCNWHEAHSRHVCELSLQLFDAFKDALDLSDQDRELLEYAALLHDIGYHISHQSHHKHALYLILNADLKGFSEEEIQIMAHVARYHRRSTPQKRHELYSALPKAVRKKVKKLAGILRVADGLDRSHYQNVKSLEVQIQPEKAQIFIQTESDPELEIWGATRKSQLLAEKLKREIEICEKV